MKQFSMVAAIRRATLGCVILACLASQSLGADDAEQENSKCLKKLGQTAAVSFYDTALSDAIQVLREESGVSIHVDERRLSAAGIDLDTPVNLELSKISHESALTLILDSVSDDLDFAIREGNVLVSTAEGKLLRSIETRVYNIADLTQAPGNTRVRLLEIMNESLRLTIADSGNPSTVFKVESLNDKLSVTCSLANHRRVHQLIRAHRSAVVVAQDKVQPQQPPRSRRGNARPDDDLFGDSDPFGAASDKRANDSVKRGPDDDLDDLFN